MSLKRKLHKESKVGITVKLLTLVNVCKQQHGYKKEKEKKKKKVN